MARKSKKQLEQGVKEKEQDVLIPEKEQDKQAEQEVKESEKPKLTVNEIKEQTTKKFVVVKNNSEILAETDDFQELSKYNKNKNIEIFSFNR